MPKVTEGQLREILSTKGYKPFLRVFGELTIDDPETVKIRVTERLVFEGDTIIRDGCRIEGRSLSFGANAYFDHNAEVGGGWCFDNESSLVCGKHFHLGAYAMINTAASVTIGDVVGIGRLSLLATHGYYLDITRGFPGGHGPIRIGSNVWLPYAIVMPNVTIGDNTVVAAGSLVNKNIKGGGLWAGWPAKQVEGIVYPNPWPSEKAAAYIESFNKDKNLLRRHGIRS